MIPATDAMVAAFYQKTNQELALINEKHPVLVPTPPLFNLVTICSKKTLQPAVSMRSLYVSSWANKENRPPHRHPFAKSPRRPRKMQLTALARKQQ